MANPYSVQIGGIATDGTNVYVRASIFDGAHTSEQLYVAFPASVTAAQIQAYFQTVANNQPVLSTAIGNLCNTIIQGQQEDL